VNMSASRMLSAPEISLTALDFRSVGVTTTSPARTGDPFLDFLNRFVSDVTGSIVAQRGVIHKYVGDEIIATWPLAAGLRDGHCVTGSTRPSVAPGFCPYAFHLHGKRPRYVTHVCRQQPAQLRPPPLAGDVAHRDGDGLLLFNQNDQPLAAGDAGVEQITLQHGVVLRHDGNHHGWVFRALAAFTKFARGVEEFHTKWARDEASRH
jgi:hypothetical protein